MRSKARYLLPLCAALALGVLSPALCWGPSGHTIVTSAALDLLPGEIKPFYAANSRYIVALVTLPDDWKQTYGAEAGPQHYIDLDLLSKPPFDDLVSDRSAAERRFGREKLDQAGTLPWEIAGRYRKLVEVIRKQDSVGIVVQSALLAHFVADAHVPFHATRFYDGRKPEQKGIHSRWEEQLLALMLKPEQVKPIAAKQVDDPLKSAFAWCISSFNQVDPILLADDKARERDPGHAYAYYKTLFRETGSLLERDLASAAEAVAGIYAAAWREAGKPALPDKAAPLFWGQ